MARLKDIYKKKKVFRRKIFGEEFNWGHEFEQPRNHSSGDSSGQLDI